jgi:DNA-binding MarR family transcriptional regulator
MPSNNNLEKLIKMSSSFVNEQYKGVVGAMVLNNLIIQDLENHLSKFKLTYQQFNILRILKGQYPKGVQLSLIKERMLHKQSDVSRLVDRLVIMEYVEKKEDELNKRRLHIRLTLKGFDLINSIEVGSDSFKSLMKSLPEHEMLKFNEIISTILAKKITSNS